MWFLRQARRERESGARGEADPLSPLGTTDNYNSAASPPIPHSVDDAPNGEPTVPTPTLGLRVQYRQTKQFKPKRCVLARNLLIEAGATSEVYSAYKILRTQIIQRLQENGWNTVAITSPTRGSGKTLTAINLAMSIAQEFDYTVLLVELDLINPAFHQFLGFNHQKGIVDHLLYDVPIPEILLNPGIDRLLVIPAGSPVRNSSELLSSSKMTRLVEELKLRYADRIVLFDLPSVLSADDAMAFSPYVDTALLVVEEGETRIDDVRRALDYLRSAQILGIVVNRAAHSDESGH